MNDRKAWMTDCENYHRRDFLKVGSAGLLGLTLDELLRAEALAREAVRDGGTLTAGQLPKPVMGGQRAKSVIMVWLAGGPATIDMWDPKPDAPDTIRGDFKPISTKVSGLQFSQHLPKMAAIADKTTVVRSIHHTIAAHELGTQYLTTGNKPNPALIYPAMGSVSAMMLKTPVGVPPYVSFSDLRAGRSGGAGYLGPAYNPFPVEAGGGRLRVRGVSLPKELTVPELDRRDKLRNIFDEQFHAMDQGVELAKGLDKFHVQALDILRNDRTQKAFQLTDESEAVRAAYGSTPFGQSALAARRLVEAGVRFVTVSLGGWDTHRDNFKSLGTRLLPQVDQILSTLIKDLDQRGLLDETIVYCAGEFARTPKVNKTAGRDHWARSMAVVVAGGGFKRGYAHGTTQADGMAPATDPISPDDLAATIFGQLGIDPHKELQTNNGRPMQLVRDGKPVEELLG
ncbi:MAG: DUF1501 domain-containing protein [Planctomycetota bacterium]